jgi:hypothetical protein
MGQHVVDLGVRHAGDQQVLPDGKADVAIAALAREGGDDPHLRHGELADGERHADPVKAWLELAMHADMGEPVIDGPRRHEGGLDPDQAATQPLLDGGEEALEAPGVEDIFQPRAVAVSAVTYGELGRAGYGAMDNSNYTQGSAGEFQVEDLCSALLRLNDGSSVALEITWASHAVDDEDISFELLGVDSGLRIFIPRYATENTLSLFGDENGKQYTRKPKVSSTGEGHLAVINEFIEHVVSGDFASHAGDYALHRTAIIDAMYRSAKAGKEVTL